MRWISLGILSHSSIDIDNELIPRLQEQFIYQLPNHKMYDSDDETHIFIFWDKILIDDNTNMNNKIREIQDTLHNNNVVVVESGKEPTFWTKHGDAVIAVIGGAIVSIAIWYFTKNPV